jgi:hypothetical protein
MLAPLGPGSAPAFDQCLAHGRHGRGEVTSTDLVEAPLGGADEVDGRLGLFLARFDDACRAAARDLDDLPQATQQRTH